MNEPSDLQTPSEPSARNHFASLRTGLLMAGSALLGGLAVVLWHRKSLANLRQPLPETNRSPKQPDAEMQ